MEPLTADEVQDAVTRALEEDIGSGDVTTLAIVGEGTTTRAVMVAREALVLAIKSPGNDHVNPTNVLEELNKALTAQGKPTEVNKPIDPAPAAPNDNK